MTYSRNAHNMDRAFKFKLLILITSVLLGHAGCIPAERSKMEFLMIKYTVADLPETPQEMIILKSGEASYVSHTNERFLQRPEIGLYESVLDPSLLSLLGTVFTQHPFSTLPDHTGNMPEGGLSRTVHLVTSSDETIKQIGPADPVESPMQNILNHLDGVVQEIMKSPQQVLRAEITSPVIDAEKNLSITLHLSNVGKENLWLRSPSQLVNQSDGWLLIETWPETPKPGTMWSEQKVNIKPYLAEPAKKTDGSPATLQLLPGASLHFTLQGNFPGEPGAYVARVSYCNFMEQFSTESLIVGQLFTNTIKI